MAITDFERYPLTFGPSPVHRLDRLTHHLGGAAVWAKREEQLDVFFHTTVLYAHLGGQPALNAYAGAFD